MAITLMSRPLMLASTACLLSSLLAGNRGLAQEARFAVVVNSGNGATNIPLNELRKIFLGERRFWPGSRPVKLVARAAGTREHKVMLNLLGMTEREYKQYWTQQVFRGEAQAEPMTVTSAEQQVATVLRTAGAIALVDVRDLKPGLKVITVDNLEPGDKSYPLRE